MVLLALLTLWPSAAFAAKGWWGWLEELSGPGPFQGPGVAVPVFCMKDSEHVSCWRGVDPAPNRRLLVGVARLGSGHNLRFKDLPDTPDNRREVKVLQISGVYMFRVLAAVDVGFGAGTMRFSGAGFEPLWRFTLIPGSVSVHPFAFIDGWKKNPWAHVVRAEIETSFVTQGLKASQFGTPASSFSVGPESVARAAIVVDFSTLWEKH